MRHKSPETRRMKASSARK